MRPDEDVRELHRLWIHSNAQRGRRRDATKRGPCIVRILQVDQLFELVSEEGILDGVSELVLFDLMGLSE